MYEYLLIKNENMNQKYLQKIIILRNIASYYRKVALALLNKSFSIFNKALIFMHPYVM